MTDTTFSTALAQAMANFAALDQIVQSDATVDVTTRGGNVPSVAKVIAGVSNKIFNSLATTSQTGINIGTGLQTFTVEAGKSFQVGQYITAVSSSARMYGTVSSYQDTTLIVNVENVVGSGSASDWSISLSGPSGKNGTNGTNGINGADAYQLAVDAGFLGTKTEWLTSLKGNKGDKGTDGLSGSKGQSAYEIAIDIGGFNGTEQDWLASLKGPQGDKGADGLNGKSAYQSAVDGGYVGTEKDWSDSLKGKDGTSITIKDQLPDTASLPAGDPDGSAYIVAGDVWVKGASGWFNAGQFLGLAGADGRSAFQIAVDNGFVGTEQDWLTSLQGPQGNQGVQGKSAYQVAVDAGFVGTQIDWLASLKGPKGDSGTGGGGGSFAEVVFPDSSLIGPTSLDAAQGNVFTITLKSNLALPPIQNPVSGETYLFVLMQDEGGGHTLTLDKKYKFSDNILPTPNTSGSTIDVMEATYSNSGYFFCLYRSGYTITQIARIAGTRYDTMQLAANAVQEGDTLYVTRSGKLSEATSYYLNDVSFTVAGDPVVNGVPTLHVDSTTHLAFSKAIINPEAGNVVVRDLKLEGAVSSDLSGAGIRNNPGVRHLRVERVTFTNNNNGLITSSPSTANIPPKGTFSMEVVDCVFDKNGTGNDGQSHNTYLQHKHRVYVLRSRYTNALYGHDFKTRADFVLLDRVYCSGAGSREMDVPDGGVIHAVNCSFIMPPKSGQNNLIGIGHEIPSDGGNAEQEYIFRNCLFENDSGGNYSETFIHQPFTSVPVKFIDCVFIGPVHCVIASPFELYYTGGPIGPEGWDQSKRGVFPPKGGTYDPNGGNQPWPDAQQPQPIYGPDPTLDIFPPTGSTATPSVRPEQLGPDVTAPTVTLSSSTTIVSNSGNILLTANASDNVGVTSVEFYRDGAMIAVDTTSPFTCTVALTDADNGTINFTAKAYDAAANVTESAPVTVTVNVLPPPTTYPFSMDNQTTSEYNTAIAGADLGTKRLAGANAVAAAMGNPYRLDIYQESTLVITLPFTTAMVVADDGTNVTVSTGTPEPSDPLVAADITAGTWHFELKGGADYSRVIMGSVGPTGSGKMIELSDNPAPGVGIQVSFVMTVPRSVDGLS